MTTIELVVTLIGVLGTLSSIFFAYLAFKRNDSIDKKANSKREGVLVSDIGYIKSSLDRLESKLEKNEERYQELLTRIVKVEEVSVSIQRRMEEHIKDKIIHK